MFTFFKKKKKEVYAFASGTIKRLEDVPDEVFAKGLLGQGIVIIPDDGTIVSPIDGEITMLFPTKHALGIKRTDGMEILLHVGIDTVSLNGQGFTSMVKEKQKVSVGDSLMLVDLPLLKEKRLAIDTICIITSPTNIGLEMMHEGTRVQAGKECILTVKEEE